ncbi:MAG: hypothetical protein WCT19_02450 [Candidatus Paceibacterota bacterium]|jgi:hypothetical protein
MYDPNISVNGSSETRVGNINCDVVLCANRGTPFCGKFCGWCPECGVFFTFLKDHLWKHLETRELARNMAVKYWQFVSKSHFGYYITNKP